MKVLVTAASNHGATAEIAVAIGAVLSDRRLDTIVAAAEEVTRVDDYDAVILGSAIFAGHWLDAAAALVDRSAGAWSARQVWLFSSGPIGDPTHRHIAGMGEDPLDLRYTLHLTGAREHRMFGGMLDRKSLPFAQRTVTRMFRGLEGDFRDWNQVSAWAAGIADVLAPM